jgi:hypothetical protein
MMKPPMNRKIVEEANAPKTSTAGATPSTMVSARPSTAVTGIGMASEIQ